MPETAGAAEVRAEPWVERGVCYAFFAYDIGLAIDLDEAQRRITALKERATIRHKRRAPRYFEYRPAPLRVTQSGERLAVGAWYTEPSVDALCFDFGAVSVSYAIPLAGSFDDLLGLSESLYENPTLLADSRRRVEQLLADVDPAIARPHIADFVETYAILQIEALRGSWTPAELLGREAERLARILRAERVALSREEVADALAARISFSPDDLALIDWEAAILFDRDPDDVRDVLEFANVELLEMRFLDQQLDDALDQAYEALTRGSWRVIGPRSARADLRRIGRLQVDAAILFEGVNNALKLLGEQYLARVYRLVSDRFHLAEWDASILRKLQTLDSIYQKLSDFAATRRMELMEWIIIILIAVEIGLTLISHRYEGWPSAPFFQSRLP